MNFKDYVLKNDVDQAENELIKIKGCLELIPMYMEQEEVNNAEKVAKKMLQSLKELNQMGKKKTHFPAQHIGFVGRSFYDYRKEN